MCTTSDRSAVATSEKKTCFDAGKIGFCHCAAVLQTQVPKLCTDLDLSLVYILIYGTHSKFARKNIFLALGLCFLQLCSSAGRRFAASRLRLQNYWRIVSFPQQKLPWNALQTGFHWESAFLAAEKTGELKNWRIWYKNQSIGSIVSARPTAAPRNGRRDNAAGIMTIWWTSPPPILQIHSLHQVAMGTPSHVPLQRRAVIIAIFRGSGTNCMGPSDWDSALRCVYGPNFRSI